MTKRSVRDNKDLSRFELDTGASIAFANYRRTPAAVIITHTETPRALRGRGIASELVQGALQLIRADGSRSSRIWWLEFDPAPCPCSGNPDRHIGQALELA